MTKSPLVYLIVLNWNGFDDTHECLQSLQHVTYPNYKVVVVDNGSADDSIDRIQTLYPELEYVIAPDNQGIARGYNLGMQHGLDNGAEYVMPMNNDLALDPEFVTEMVRTQQSHAGCGVVMPKIYYYEAPDVIWSNGGRTRWFESNILLKDRKAKDVGQFNEDIEINYAPSCCLLITREVAEKIQFDEKYFFYYDDWDFCVQVREFGRKIFFSSQAKMWHKVSQSTQNSPKSQRWWRILGQSCARFHRKHHSTGLLLLYVSWVVLREIIKGNIKSLPTFLSGIRLGMKAENLDEMIPGWEL